jgi:nicotinamide mononucleotide adenylyltransferase
MASVPLAITGVKVALSSMASAEPNTVKNLPETARAEPLSVDGFPLHKLQTPKIPGIPKVVLIECGSFSPITNMHLLLFEMNRDDVTKEHLHWEVIGGIVSPVHDGYGKASLVSAEHRKQMCELATADSPWIAVSDWELRRDGWTPTCEVLDAYQAALDASGLYHQDGGVRVKLMMGTDVLESMLVPGLWAPQHLERILGSYGVVVTERVGSDTKGLIEMTPLLKRFQANIHVCPPRVTNDISSTLVRSQLAKGQSVKYLTPDPVAAYIREQGLYGVKPAYSNAPVLADPAERAAVAARL